MMTNVGPAIQLSFNKYNLRSQAADGGVTRRHPILPAMNFVIRGRELNVTDADLQNMAALLRSGDLGARRMVTLAHPDNPDAAPAVGWLLTNTAEVAPYKDTTALYCEVEWLSQMAADIQAKKYAYLSPVLSMDYTDQSGNERGPALLMAGVTNDPHWTSQPELLEAFTARAEMTGPGHHSQKWHDIWEALKRKGYDADRAAAIATSIEGGVKMSADSNPDEIVAAWLRDHDEDKPAGEAEQNKEANMAQDPSPEVVKLTANLAERDKQIAALTAKNAEQEKQLVELTAKSSNAEQLEKRLASTEKDLAEVNAALVNQRGDALVNEAIASGYAPIEFYMGGDQTKRTALCRLAYSDVKAFREELSAKPKAKVPPAQPVGHGSQSGHEDEKAANEKVAMTAFQMADAYMAAHPGTDWNKAWALTKNAIATGTELK